MTTDELEQKTGGAVFRNPENPYSLALELPDGRRRALSGRAKDYPSIDEYVERAAAALFEWSSRPRTAEA